MTRLKTPGQPLRSCSEPVLIQKWTLKGGCAGLIDLSLILVHIPPNEREMSTGHYLVKLSFLPEHLAFRDGRAADVAAEAGLPSGQRCQYKGNDASRGYPRRDQAEWLLEEQQHRKVEELVKKGADIQILSEDDFPHLWMLTFQALPELDLASMADIDGRRTICCWARLEASVQDLVQSGDPDHTIARTFELRFNSISQLYADPCPLIGATCQSV